jgi:hypothetical protein
VRGTWKVARPIVTTQLKMEDASIFRNVIEIFLAKKSNQGKKRRALSSF